MIEGLKVTVSGEKLADLAYDRAVFHAEREGAYAEQIANLKNAKVEGMQYSGGDPISALEAKRQQHENDASELDFIAENIDRKETYLLDREALRRLGIVRSQY